MNNFELILVIQDLGWELLRCDHSLRHMSIIRKVCLFDVTGRIQQLLGDFNNYSKHRPIDYSETDTQSLDPSHDLTFKTKKAQNKIIPVITEHIFVREDMPTRNHNYISASQADSITSAEFGDLLGFGIWRYLTNRKSKPNYPPGHNVQNWNITNLMWTKNIPYSEVKKKKKMSWREYLK